MMGMQLIDTHCHIHETGYPDPKGAYERALKADVGLMLCVGTSEQSSREAVAFSERHDGCWAVVGAHPHEAKDGIADIERILSEKSTQIVGIGEIGLDYFYDHSPRDVQIKAFERQLQLARDYDLPVSFHVREAFEDFWPVFGNFTGIRGVLHSFTDTVDTLETALSRGLYIGVNGISTFARDKQDVFAAIPLDRMLLETDAPFLTPVPHRGTVNEPAFVRNVAEFHAEKRGISLDEVAATTTTNARALFAL